MVRRGLRGKSYVNTVVPKRGSVRVYGTKVKKSRVCASTGNDLHGIKHKGSKSSKRVSRIYGGFFSSKVTRLILKDSVRSIEVKEDV